MTGEGDYDRHSEGQQRDAAAHADLVADAARTIEPDPERDSVVIADYGCAQGRSSNTLLELAVDAVRERDLDVPITVVHNDLLANDWSTMLAYLRAPGSYLDVAGGPITPTISATSFYEPVVPAGIVDLGISFAAVQWLAEPGPAGTGSAIYFDQLQGASRAAMAAQAHEDWTRFLRLRSAELAPGGRIVLDMMGVDADGVAAGHDAWRLARSILEELVDEGRLDASRLDGYVIPVYERTIAEARRPFDEGSVDALVLEHLSMASSVVPPIEHYRESGDRASMAADLVGFFRAFSEPSLRAELDLADDAVEELYARLQERVAAEADDFAFTVNVLTMVVAAPGAGT